MATWYVDGMLRWFLLVQLFFGESVCMSHGASSNVFQFFACQHVCMIGMEVLAIVRAILCRKDALDEGFGFALTRIYTHTHASGLKRRMQFSLVEIGSMSSWGVAFG